MYVCFICYDWDTEERLKMRGIYAENMESFSRERVAAVMCTGLRLVGVAGMTVDSDSRYACNQI